MDKQKRNTVKVIAAAVATTALSGPFSSGLASNASEAPKDLSRIKVYTRVSQSTNDVEVVMQNTGNAGTVITQITPSQTVTRRGTFDFSQLLKEGELHLSPGQSISVPMTPRPVVLDASTSATQRAQSLSAALRKSFSVITENEAFARVDVSSAVRFS